MEGKKEKKWIKMIVLCVAVIGGILWSAPNKVQAKVSDFDIQKGVLVSYNGNDKNVVIPSGVKKIGEGCFFGNEKIEKVTIPEGVTEIEIRAFGICENLKSVTIPKSVKKIGVSAFADCKSLKSVTIPKSVKKIGVNAFAGCENLKSAIIPDGVVKIEDGTFSGCKKLKNIKLPNSLKAIGEGAFEWTALEKITIPQKVTEIGERAFFRTSIKKISFPKSIKSVGESALAGCSKLREITVLNKKAKLTDVLYCQYGIVEGKRKLLSNDIIIHGYKNSTAEKLAKSINKNKSLYGKKAIFKALKK